MTISEVSKKYNLSEDALRYYERVGMIPPVPRTAGGIRNYGEAECKWIELAKCMRSAGLPVEAMTEYLKLYLSGDSTIPQRTQLLERQRDALLKQREQIDEMLNRLQYKISRYKIAEETGVLSWDEDGKAENFSDNKKA